MRLLIIFALALMLLGCAGTGGTRESGGAENGSASMTQNTPEAGEGMAAAPEDTQPAGPETGDAWEGGDIGQEQAGSGDAESSGTAPGKTDVLMLGRSVAYGWSEYMGLEWQEDESYVGEYDGKTFRYLHMDSPPDIDDSAIRAIETYDYDIVFFKLCFVDFGSEYGDMLADDKQYVQNVYQEAVVNRHKKLIIGNALPQVSKDTTPGLRQNHQEYNRWLDEFASTHDDVYVLDLYGALADGSGNLKSAYATSYEDSHPNSAGYAAITPAFMDKIDEAMGD